MLAEIVKHYHPRLVDLHNYVPTCNTDQKLSNWSTLNRQALRSLPFSCWSPPYALRPSPTLPGVRHKFSGCFLAVGFPDTMPASVFLSIRIAPSTWGSWGGPHREDSAGQLEAHSLGYWSCLLTVCPACADRSSHSTMIQGAGLCSRHSRHGRKQPLPSRGRVQREDT